MSLPTCLRCDMMQPKYVVPVQGQTRILGSALYGYQTHSGTNRLLPRSQLTGVRTAEMSQHRSPALLVILHIQ